MIARAFQTGAVRGFLHQPTHPAGDGLVLTHGAGGNCEGELLRAIAAAFCDAGTLVLRCDLLFRQRRASGPPRPGDAELDRSGLAEAVSVMRAEVSGPLHLGGHSYGGRQASMLAADRPELADALLLLSYPLHPPEKANHLRTAHWPNLKSPAFFVHGSKDPFGSPGEMNAALALIPATKSVVVLDGAGHDLKRGKFDIGNVLVSPFRAFAKEAERI